jgi:hypothetical protein
MFRLPTIVTLILLAFAGPAAAQSDACSTNGIVKHDGECWETLTFNTRYGIIWGIWTGIETRARADRLAGNNPNYYFGVDWASSRSGTRVGDIERFFSSLYAAPAHRAISWTDAYLLAALNGRDDDSNDQAGLLRMFRDGASLPTTAKLVGVKNANTLLVDDAGVRSEIVLAGTTLADVPAGVQKQAVEFLRSLLRTTDTRCDRKHNDQIAAIAYSDDVFNEEGKLTGYVKLIAGFGVCLGDELVRYGQFQGDASQDLQLNHFLLRNGFVKHQPSRDPKWRDDRKNTRQFLGRSEELAKVDRLGMHGGGFSPVVSLIASRRPH